MTGGVLEPGTGISSGEAALTFTSLERVANLGRHALQGASIAELLDEAADILVETLQVSRAGILQVLPDRDEAIVRVARGWKLPTPGVTRVPVGPGTQLGHTIAVKEPVIVDDFASDPRFEVSEISRAEGIASGVTVPIRGHDRPWGILGVHSLTPRRFTRADASFLRTVANVLAAAILRYEAEQRLLQRDAEARLALDVGRMGTWRWDPATGVVHWSEELEAVYGIPPRSFGGTFDAYVERVHPEDRDAVVSEIERAVREERPLRFEHRAVHPDGSVHWIEGRGRPVRGPDGGSQWVGVGIDVTERKTAFDERARLLQLERTAREQAEHISVEFEHTVARLDTLLASAPVGFAFFDTDLRFVSVNRPLAEMFGGRVEDFPGRDLADAVPDLAPAIGAGLRRVLEQTEPVVDADVAGQTPARPGSERHWLASYYPVLGSGRRVVGIGAVVTEITERRRAERAERLLRHASELLASTDDLRGLLDRLARLAIPDFADFCALYLVDSPARMSRVAIAHRDAEAERRLRDAEPFWPLAVDSGTPSARAVRTGRPQLIARLTEEMRVAGADRESQRRLAREVSIGSVVAAPLVAGGRILGAITFMYDDASGRRYDEADVHLAEELARRCGNVIERLRVAAEAVRAQARLELLARVGELMEVDLDSTRRLEHLTRLVVPDLADVCAAYTLEDDGVRAVAVAVADEDVAARVKALAWPAHDLDSPMPAARAVRDRRTVVADIEDRVLEAIHSGPRLELAREAGVEQVLAVPLLAGDEAIGALTFGYGSGHRYDAADERLAEEIARRVAPAVVHAIRFERERQTAEVLQRSLLPSSVPRVERVETEARYLAGTEGLRVGGDWYDFVPLPGGRLLCSIGDVVGHGVQAAALMGQLRTALRLGVLDDDEPGPLLQRLNRYLIGIDRAEMATCALVVVDPSRNEARWASAGHPPPIVRGADGSTRWLEAALGPPLGAAPHARYPQRAGALAPGDVLLLYTDGLVERRTEPLDAGLERLARVLGSRDRFDGTCEALIDALLGDAAPADDVAVLALRLGPAAAALDVTVPALPGQLAALRGQLRRWLARAGAADTDVADITLAANEAVTNVVEHAYGLHGGDVHVHAAAEGDEVVVTVSDEGRWRGTSPPGGGRGLPLVRNLMDGVEVDAGHGHGTRVVMRRRLRPRTPSLTGG